MNPMFVTLNPVCVSTHQEAYRLLIFPLTSKIFFLFTTHKEKLFQVTVIVSNPVDRSRLATHFYHQ